MQEIKQPRGMGSASMGVECSFKCGISMEVTIQQKLKISHMYVSSRGNVCQDKGNSYCKHLESSSGGQHGQKKRVLIFPGIYICSSDKEPTCQSGDIRYLGWIPGLGDLSEKEVAIYSSILAWRIPWIEESGGLQSTESQLNITEHVQKQYICQSSSNGTCKICTFHYT